VPGPAIAEAPAELAYIEDHEPATAARLGEGRVMPPERFETLSEAAGILRVEAGGAAGRIERPVGESRLARFRPAHGPGNRPARLFRRTVEHGPCHGIDPSPLCHGKP
jgi:hypothetical protein